MQINFRNEEGLTTEHCKRRTGQEGNEDSGTKEQMIETFGVYVLQVPSDWR